MKTEKLSIELKTFLAKAKKPLVVLLGPTASGKTALSLQIAHGIGGEIISTDSRQIYKGLEIGSDILDEKAQDGIPHHMMGITAPDKPISLYEYHRLALQKIKEIRERGNIPMLVGGTGLYISSIIDNYDMREAPGDPVLRKKLEKELEKNGAKALHDKLVQLDPESAEKIHPNNTRYVIRALEINLTTGSQKIDAKASPQFDVFMIGIKWPREELYERVGQRVEIQIKRGLVEEVRALLDAKFDESLPAMSSLGAKEIFPYIRGEMTLEECKEILKRSTRRYAKRQMTWFRRYDNVHWLSPK